MQRREKKSNSQRAGEKQKRKDKQVKNRDKRSKLEDNKGPRIPQVGTLGTRHIIY